MSVIMTMRVSGDPARFEETVAAEAEAIGRIMDVAKRNGLIAHRWYGSDGEFMAVDEWTDEQSFQAFMGSKGSSRASPEREELFQEFLAWESRRQQRNRPRHSRAASRH